MTLLLGTGLLLTAADKRGPSNARGENEDLILTVTLYDDPVLVKQAVGADMDGYIVAAVKVEPKYGKEILIDRDDFHLRTDKDGERVTPFAPSQIAATDAVTVSHGPTEGAASPGMVLAGPLVLHGGALAKNKKKEKEDDDSADAKVTAPADNADNSDAAKKDNPLKKLLEEKVLPERKTEQPVSGLLYFPMDKQKRKDLELIYGGRENRIALRFK
jgi:hypothetical protein